MAKLPVVIVTRNSLHLSKKCITSALAQDVPVEVLVVDNCSTDGTRPWLAGKNVATIFTPEQWSLAKCWNVALRTLWKAGYTRALVLNNDVELLPCAIRLLNAVNAPFVTCVSVENQEQFNADPEPTVETLISSQRPHPDYSCFMIRKSATDKNLWFNEDCWPAYCEDAFHHIALHQAGINAICVSLPFLHHGASTIKNCSESERLKISRGAGKNRLLFKGIYGCMPGSPEYYAMFGHSEPAPHAMT